MNTLSGRTLGVWIGIADLAVPPNTTAKVSIPAAAPDRVREGDGPAARAPGVKFLATTPGGRVLLETGGGRYRFEAPWTPATARD
jgi:hypothetical protein